MAIPAVNSVNTKNSLNKPKQKFNYVTITGYGALALGTASAIAGYKKKIKPHKYFAYIAGALAFVHTGIIEFYHHKKNNAAKKS